MEAMIVKSEKFTFLAWANPSPLRQDHQNKSNFLLNIMSNEEWEYAWDGSRGEFFAKLNGRLGAYIGSAVDEHDGCIMLTHLCWEYGVGARGYHASGVLF